MSTAKKATVAAFAAMLLLALTTGSASALRSIEFSRTLINLLSRALTFQTFANVICEIGLNTTLANRASAKTANGVIGRTTVAILRCSTGTAVALSTPWNVKYKSISGTLPRISGLSIQIERMQLRFTNILTCLVTAEVTPLQIITPETGVVGNMEGNPYLLQNVTTVGACTPEEFRFRGTFEPTNGPTTIRLI